MTIPSQNRFQIQNRFNGLSKGIAKLLSFLWKDTAAPSVRRGANLISPATRPSSAVLRESPELFALSGEGDSVRIGI